MSREYPREDDEPRCHSNLDATLAARGEVYGDYNKIAKTAQDLKEMMREHPGWKSLTAPMKETLEMNASKISRILNGDPFHTDNWHDIAGYSQLTEDSIRG